MKKGVGVEGSSALPCGGRNVSGPTWPPTSLTRSAMGTPLCRRPLVQHAARPGRSGPSGWPHEGNLPGGAISAGGPHQGGEACRGHRRPKPRGGRLVHVEPAAVCGPRCGLLRPAGPRAGPTLRRQTAGGAGLPCHVDGGLVIPSHGPGAAANAGLMTVRPRPRFPSAFFGTGR